MSKQKKTSVVDIINSVVTVLPMVFIILAVGLGFLRLHLRTESAVTVTAECQVVDKFTKTYGRGGEAFFITLLVPTSGGEFEGDVQISEESALNGVFIGDILPCTVMYDEEGIVKIQVSDSSLVQQIDYQEDLSTVMFICFGIVAVVTGFIGFFLLIKRLDKKAYEQSIENNNRSFN